SEAYSLSLCPSLSHPQGDLCQCLGLSHHIPWFRGAISGPESLGEMAGRQGGGVRVSDVDFDKVPVRVYEPPAAGGGDGGLRRAVMFYHGGGWALGTTKMGSYDVLCRQMSDELNAVVVSVEYRLAPEVHFPVQYKDCLAAAKHFLELGILGKLSVDPQRVAVSGDSAGGNLAAAVAQQVHTHKHTHTRVYDGQVHTHTHVYDGQVHTHTHTYTHTHTSMMARFWLLYLGVDTSLHPLLLSPSFLHHPSIPPSLRSHLNWTTLLPAKHIKHYKPVGMEMGSQEVTGQEGDLLPGLLDVRAAAAYIVTCEYDVLRDDGLMYTRRLQDAGVAVSSHHYDDGFHGALSFAHWPFFFDVGERMIRGYMDWLQENL
uniref:Neutral cholesterol ester hydrolase 1a n=1 Tax=Oncorhynchus tshawytscha TaxID=74940 RepID=A0AAZ3SML9_ONCTS